MLSRIERRKRARETKADRYNSSNKIITEARKGEKEKDAYIYFFFID